MTCFFATNRPIGCVRSAGTDLSSICCSVERWDGLLSIKPISEYLPNLPSSLNLYGCSALELLFLRGNGELPEMDDDANKLICKSHLDFLLLKWPNKDQVKRSRQKGREIIKCSLPHESARAVIRTSTMRKDEVIEWMAKTGELVHVGSPICSCHRSSILNADDRTTVVSMGRNVPPKRGHNVPDDTDFNLDSMDLEPDFREDDVSDSDNDDNFANSSEEVRNEISSHFSAIAKLMGKNDYHTKFDWQVLSADAKRRKISLVLSMVQMLCTLVAPGSSSELCDAVSEKLSSKKQADTDTCSQQVLTAIGDRMLEAPNRRARIETLALIVDLPYFCSSKILTKIPTVTKYLIHKARIFNCGGINFDEKYMKVRYNTEALDFFVSFVVRCNVLLSLPWKNNYATKSDGTKVEMGASVRLQAYIKIDRMFREQLRKYDKGKEFHLSYGTIYQLLSSMFPNKNRRMVCVDEYFVDAGEGWDRLLAYVHDLGRMGFLLSKEESDLERRLKLSRSFLEGSYRSHIETSSTVLEHCATFALSDKEKKAYQRECDHIHDMHCDECLEVDRVLDILSDKLSAAKDKSEKGNQAVVNELKRMIGMTVKSVKYIDAYRSHIVRAVISDNEKAIVQDALLDNEALITADWAQKVLPQSAIEGQSGYFGKGGMSVHITHIYAKLNGRLYHHVMQHVFESSKQQSYDVSCIFRHGLHILEKRGITKVTLRSDNAGCYKSKDLVGDLYQIANDTPRIDRYIYSESQAGKGPCDRAASHMKRQIRECTEARINVRDAQEIFDALTKNDVVRGTSTYRCAMGPPDTHKQKKSAISDMSSLYEITFQTDGILARKHCGIGKGQTTDKSKLIPLNSSFVVLEEGGCIDDDTFWVCLNASEAEKEEVREEVDDEQMSLRKDFMCSTPGCLASFIRHSNLEKHEIHGKHIFKPSKKSMLDYAIDAFTERIETVQVAQEGRANDSFATIQMNTGSKWKMGWALKKTGSDGISDKAHNEAAEYFMAQRSMVPPRRAEPRAFSLMMETMRNIDGSYKFEAHELLSEKQLTGLFSRFETKRVSGVTVARKPRGRQQSKSSRKRAHPVSSEEDVVVAQEETGDDLEGEDYEPEMDEEDFVRDCIRRKHNDIFL